MLTPSRLSATIDRRLLELIQARARQRTPILRLLPPRWLAPVLAPTAKRLRTKLLTALLALSAVILGTALWLTLQ